ncbi:MAG: hypothetical protein ACOC0P_01425, partial [Planctomycetota bacterium]
LPNPQTDEGDARDISDSNLIAGSLGDYAVLWLSDGEVRELPMPNPFDTGSAVAVNSRQEAVGYIGLQQPVLWANGQVIPLQSLIPPGSGWTVLEVTDLNDSGWIIGLGELEGAADLQGFALVPVVYDFAIDLPFTAGRLGTFRITGATPGAIQYLVYSIAGPGRTPVPPLNIELDLNQPSLAIAANATGDGTLRLRTFIPQQAKGREVWFQVAEFGRTTPPTSLTVE